MIVGGLSLFCTLDREPPAIRPIHDVLAAAAGVLSLSELFQLDLPHWDGRNVFICANLPVPWRPAHPPESFPFKCQRNSEATLSFMPPLFLLLFTFPPNTAFGHCDVNGGCGEERLSPLFLEQALHNCSSEQRIKLPVLSK